MCDTVQYYYESNKFRIIICLLVAVDSCTLLVIVDGVTLIEVDDASMILRDIDVDVADLLLLLVIASDELSVTETIKI